MSYYVKLSNGYAERLRYAGNDWYIWEAKAPGGQYGNGWGLTSYAGHESTFIPPLTAQDRAWAKRNA